MSVVIRGKDFSSMNKRVIRQSFNVHDQVYWKKPIAKKGLGQKQSRIWQGPYKVKKKISDYTYIINDDDRKEVSVK